MAIYKLVLPKMGESVEEATITNWVKNVGDKIEEEDTIVEVATDKVDSEVPSPVSGVVKEILLKKDEIAKVGQPMALIEIEGEVKEEKETLSNSQNDNNAEGGEVDYEITLPKMGESVEEATITNWVKNVGDTVEEEDTIVEVATDKVDSEVPSPVNGVIKEILLKKNEVAKVGQPMAIITTTDKVGTPVSNKKTENKTNSQPTPQASNNTKSDDSAELTRFYSPLVKNIAKKENISNSELENIKGSGFNGRVNKDNILEYVNRGRKQSSKDKVIGKVDDENIQPAPVFVGGNDEVIEMGRMRKMIADHMVMSKRVSPHVTSCIETDVTNVVLWRNKVKDEYLKKFEQKITFTPIFLQAISEAIKKLPMINVSIDGNNIIKKGNINIGMATALPTGDLIVPVIKNADRQNLLGLTTSVNDLATRARANKLIPDDIQGATYTLTNIGGFGNTIATPIINQPQVAILAVGAIIKKPAVLETPQGDVIAIRNMMYMSHSYDHRVVDGSLGAMFLKEVSDYLENWNINTPI